jgi:hypothetical protein
MLCEKAFKTSCTLCLCYIFVIKSQICCLSIMNILSVINHVFITTMTTTSQLFHCALCVCCNIVNFFNLEE